MSSISFLETLSHSASLSHPMHHRTVLLATLTQAHLPSKADPSHIIKTFSLDGDKENHLAVEASTKKAIETAAAAPMKRSVYADRFRHGPAIIHSEIPGKDRYEEYRPVVKASLKKTTDSAAPTTLVMRAEPSPARDDTYVSTDDEDKAGERAYGIMHSKTPSVYWGWDEPQEHTPVLEGNQRVLRQPIEVRGRRNQAFWRAAAAARQQDNESEVNEERGLFFKGCRRAARDKHRV